MTVYNKASLVLAESPAYKAGKIQPYYPLTPDVSFDFTRATSATRVNASGNIEKETQNLLVQSNQFDTSWGGNPSNRSITGGFSGYDGTNNAWKLEALSNSNYSVVNQVVSSTGVQTFSIYAKAGTSNFLRIQITGGTNTSASYFNLSGSGSLGTDFNNIDAKIEPVGNGWFRCSVMGNKTASSTCVVYVVDANNSSNVTTGANVYIQDAQLEQGLVARNYQETTTAAFYGGITDNIPRLDYTDSSCPSLLLEPQRTNLVIHSEYLEGLNQNSADLSLSSNLSPEGKYNAYRAEWVTGSQIGYSFAATNGETYTTSIYARSISGSGKIKITDYQGTETEFTITSEWARYELTATATQSTGRAYVRLKQSGDVVELYGLQSEAGSYATSYIPTYGASVTRNADDLDRLTNLSTNGIANNYSTTLFFEGTNFKTTANTRFVTLYNSSASSNPRVLLFSSNSNSSVFYMNLQYRATGQTDANVASGNMSYNTKFKAIMRLDGTSLSLFLDGTKYSTTIVQADDIEVLDLADVAADLSHTMSELAIFPTALTDDECIALTTL